MKPAPPVIRIDSGTRPWAAADSSAYGASPFSPAALRSALALSVRSQVNSRSLRPKWPYAAVFA